MPSFSVYHQLLKLAQTHPHWVSDAIQPSHPLLSPSLPTLNLSQPIAKMLLLCLLILDPGILCGSDWSGQLDSPLSSSSYSFGRHLFIHCVIKKDFWTGGKKNLISFYPIWIQDWSWICVFPDTLVILDSKREEAFWLGGIREKIRISP